jgi:hypothetical protein
LVSDNHPTSHLCAGANVVIEKIRTSRGVTRLNLGINNLGDPGCIRLFQFLRSEEGKALDVINELTLNSNSIGNAGLIALIGWLRGNVHLQSLYLQNVRTLITF